MSPPLLIALQVCVFKIYQEVNTAHFFGGNFLFFIFYCFYNNVFSELWYHKCDSFFGHNEGEICNYHIYYILCMLLHGEVRKNSFFSASFYFLCFLQFFSVSFNFLLLLSIFFFFFLFFSSSSYFFCFLYFFLLPSIFFFFLFFSSSFYFFLLLSISFFFPLFFSASSYFFLPLIDAISSLSQLPVDVGNMAVRISSPLCGGNHIR